MLLLALLMTVRRPPPLPPIMGEGREGGEASAQNISRLLEQNVGRDLGGLDNWQPKMYGKAYILGGLPWMLLRIPLSEQISPAQWTVFATTTKP